MNPYPLQLEISGPTAMWTRPDTGSSPVSYVAPTFSAVKGIFESILRWKSVNVRPTRLEICAPVRLHRPVRDREPRHPAFLGTGVQPTAERNELKLNPE